MDRSFDSEAQGKVSSITNRNGPPTARDHRTIRRNPLFVENERILKRISDCRKGMNRLEIQPSGSKEGEVILGMG